MIEKLIAIVAGWIIALISQAGYLGILALMTIESAGVPAPSELIMPFSGYLVSVDSLNFYLVVVAGTLGNVIGSLIAYAIGFYGGRPLIERYGKYIFLSRHELDLADKFFQSKGSLTVFVGRLLPIIRTYISFPAGIAKMPLNHFISYSALGALIWSILLTEIGMKLGENWESIRQYGRILDVVVGVSLIITIGYFIYTRRKR